MARILGKLVSGFICVILLCVGMCVSTDDAYAATTGTNGTCSWSIDDDGVLTVFPTDGVSGTLDSTSFPNGPWHNYASSIKKVTFAPGVAAGTSCYRMFYAFTNCTEIDVSHLDTSQVTDMSGMFVMCYKLTSLDLSNFDTNDVTNIDGMFSLCNVLSSVTLGENFNFHGNGHISTGAKLPIPPTSSSTGKWVRDDYRYGPYTPEELRDAYDGSTMSGTYVWEKRPVAVFDSSDGSLKFYGSETATTFVPTSTQTVYTGWDINAYTSSSRIPWYSNRKNITSVEVVDEGIKPISTAYWFNDCSNMISCDVSKLDTCNVTSMTRMFNGCSQLTFVDVSNFDTSKVTDMSYMFVSCSKFQSLDLSRFDTSSVINMSFMFSGCSKLTSLDLSNFDTGYVTSMAAMFKSCTSLASLDIASFDVANVADMSSMFDGCQSLESLDVSHFDTSKVSNMSRMFSSCSGLASLDLSNFVTSKVTNMAYMFYSCSNLASLDLNNFNTFKVTNMSYMFAKCSNLTLLDVSNFDTSKVTTMLAMFYDCGSLKLLDLGCFDTANVTSMNSIFLDCRSLESLDIGGFDMSKVDSVTSMFGSCNSLNRVTLGEKFSFKSTAHSTTTLPTPPSNITSGKWVLEDKSQPALTPSQLRDTYNGSTMAGTYVWDMPSYIVSFDANGGTGEMAHVLQPVTAAYTVPSTSNFYRKGYEFTGWSLTPDGEVISSIGANIYQDGDTVMLYALWEDATNFNKLGEGEFEFDLEAGSKMWFANIPAGTSYKVYEETPSGWVLVDKSNDSGVVQPNSEQAAEFTNTYDPTKTSVVITGKKLVDGMSYDTAGYTFELRDSNNQLVGSSATAADGTISFDPIEYSQVGEYVYTIKEIVGSDNTLNYDGHVDIVTANVMSQDGVLKASVTYDDDGVVFNNTHKDGVLRIMKLVQDVIADTQDGEFTIDVTLKDANGNPVIEGVEVKKADVK